jgi:hypothetical protein
VHTPSGAHQTPPSPPPTSPPSKVCLYAGFPPAAILFPNGTWGGEEVQHLTSFAKAHNLALTVVEVPSFKGIWLQPGLGNCDLAAGGISITPSRVTELGTRASFSTHYRADARALAVRSVTASGAPRKVVINGPKDLAGRVILVTNGSTAETDLKARLKAAGVTATLHYTNSEDKAGADVAAGTVLKGSKEPVFAYATGAEGALALANKLKGRVAAAWVHCLMLADGTEVPEHLGYVARTPTTSNKRDTSLLDALNAYVVNTKGGPQGKWPSDFIKCPPAQNGTRRF